jgi:hypothetical protein
VIAGYFGSDVPGHPNKGYTVASPYTQAAFVNENFPNSAQTQVTGLNDGGATVGFWVNTAGRNFGWFAENNRFRTANYPFKAPLTNTTDQLLGVNYNGLAVGFAVNSAGATVAYSYNIRTGAYALVAPNNLALTNPMATGVNDRGQIVGSGTTSGGKTVSFLEQPSGTGRLLVVPGADATTAFGVNNGSEVVGSYTVGTVSHGFIWAPGFGFETVDDPNGIGTTVVNGVNDNGRLVGFYVDSAGNTDGMSARPK